MAKNAAEEAAAAIAAFQMVGGQKCKTCAILNGDKHLADVFLSILKTPGGSTSVAWRYLRSKGYEMSTGSVQKHVREHVKR